MKNPFTRMICKSAFTSKPLPMIFCVLFGMLMGLISKMFDSVSLIGDITTELGIWILLASLIAAFSRSAKAAALHVFLFFASMLTVYYLYTLKLFGYFPFYVFMRWMVIAVCSPICAWMIYLSRGKNIAAVIFASLPVSLLLAQGFSFFYTFSLVRAFDLFSALILILLLPANSKNRILVFMLAVVLAFLLVKFHVISMIFGGL